MKTITLILPDYYDEAITVTTVGQRKIDKKSHSGKYSYCNGARRERSDYRLEGNFYRQGEY